MFIKELNKMFGKHLVLVGFFALEFSCSSENKSSSGEDALEAFSKIDKKNENLFTQEDRKNKFKNSIVRNLDKESLSKMYLTTVMDQHHQKR